VGARGDVLPLGPGWCRGEGVGGGGYGVGSEKSSGLAVGWWGGSLGGLKCSLTREGCEAGQVSPDARIRVTGPDGMLELGGCGGGVPNRQK